MGGIGIWQLVIVAVIVVLLFGTKKLRNLGTDLGSAVKGFKKSVSDDNEEKISNEAISEKSTVETSVESKEKDKV